MKNQKAKYLVICIVVLVGFIVFGLGGNYLKKQSQPSPSPITSMADKINNWKTYTNSSLGLTFKYPQNWINPSVRPQSTHTEISFDPSNANLSLIMGFDYNQTTGKNLTYSETISSATANLKSQEDFLLDGIKGKKITYTMGASTLDILYIVPVPNGSGDILKIQYTVPHGDPDTSKLFDQILSTFKFLDNSNNVTSHTNNYNTAIKILQAVPEIQIIENAVMKNGRKTFFMQGDVNGDIVKIWFYEGGFSDQHTTRIDTFMVNVKTGEILVDDFVNNKNISLKDWGMTITQRFPDYGPQKVATVLVQDGSTYGPPFDPNLYQLEISKSEHLFAKSDLVDLKKYLGKNIKVHYREVKGVIMGEQQLVTVDSVE